MDPVLFENFLRSRFSKHFARLTKLGMWPVETWDVPRKKRYLCYRLTLSALTLSAIGVQMVDLYKSLDNFRKITYNLCTSVIVLSITLKMIFLNQRKELLDGLRWKLWRDSLLFADEEDIAIQDVAFNHLSYMGKWFYAAVCIVLPAWIVVSYFSYLWGPRELAFSGYLPIDTSDDRVYVPTLCYQALCASYVISLVIEADLSMFSIILQISAQYQILMKNMLRLNLMYQEEKEEEDGVAERAALPEVCPKKGILRKEVNEYLKSETAKKRLQSFVLRQIEISEYINTFELIYNRCMFVQIFGGACLILMNGLEVTVLAHEISAKLCYQMGYLALIMIDILFICYYLSELSSESYNVGNAAYRVVWYKMEPELRRILSMIIIRSQKPPRTTSGKLFLMDLRTYLEMLRNIYSWLMLFRQLGLK